jgi:hypothetical protein
LYCIFGLGVAGMARTEKIRVFIIGPFRPSPQLLR